MLRSVLAVVAGYALIGAAIMLLFLVWFRDPSVQPTTGFMLFALAYGCAAAVAGGYIAALLARRAPLVHAAVLAGIGLVAGGAGLLGSDGTEPLWFQLANLAIMITGVLVGGVMRSARAEGRGAQARSAGP